MHIATARDWDFHVLEANHTLFFVNDGVKHFLSMSSVSVFPFVRANVGMPYRNSLPVVPIA